MTDMNESPAYQNLDRMDLHWVVQRLPVSVRDLLKTHGPKLFLAGGYIRAVVAAERVSDIDLFCASQAYALATATALADTSKRKRLETINAYTVFTTPIPTQFIFRWLFERPEDALASFDFTIAQAALWWDGEHWVSRCSSRFYTDLAAKRLVYTRPSRTEEAGGSMLRLLKFYQRGYRIPLESLGAVIARLCRGIREEGWRDEQHAALVITGLLREVDPLIDPDHITHFPSEGDAPTEDP